MVLYNSTSTGGAQLPPPPPEDFSAHMQFKLDNVPRLTDGTGYRSWCSIATLYLRSRLLWRIVDGTETRPIDATLLEKWELKNISAQLLLTLKAGYSGAAFVYCGDDLSSRGLEDQDYIQLSNAKTHCLTNLHVLGILWPRPTLPPG